MPRLKTGQVWRRRDGNLVSLKKGRGSLAWYMDDIHQWIYCDDERNPQAIPKFVFNAQTPHAADLVEYIGEKL